MSMEEMTAYAVAWRTGGVWELPPNPIPIDYVTCAAALWRGGEIYEIDARIGGPPGWWVNTTMPLKTPVRLSELSSSVTRIVPGAFVPGDTVKIAVQVTPPGAARAYAVEEALPPGTTLTSISHGGVVDAASRRVKWGPFLDAAPRVLEYQLLTQSSILSDITFQGNASFDGFGTIPEGGILSRCGALLTCSPQQPGTLNLSLRLRGVPGASYALESSVDLEHWTAFTTVTDSDNETIILPNTRDTAGKRYYRAKLLP
jgi:hypothetical protein